MNKIKKVIRADVMGFCMGVKSVMDKVETQINLDPERTLFTYGPLIHNPQVIERLESRGIVPIESPSDKSGGTVIIRAHGIHPEVRKEFVSAGYSIVEGTCPRVLHSQKIVTSHSQDGWYIVLVGDKGHGEVKSIAGCAEKCVVVLSEEDAMDLDIPEKTLVIAQTTLSGKEYGAICDILQHKNPGIKIIRSICPATKDRQTALLDLTSRVDAVIVVGGKNSANTRRLYLSALNEGVPSWHVEDEDALPSEIYEYTTVGISAGASTPDWMIERIEAKLLG
ncbi:MAG: 4-hydroxy-3-methylbut-2-enyl diphosphate reductase [Spirochaetales bacterium]|nr:4-hydroxy-3-methylbut-2-enyl diphosphate reductase [Spirochaetales bacterium]